MISRLLGLLSAVRRSVEVRGGGLRGLGGVVVRAWRMQRAMGFRGIAARIRIAGRPRPATPTPETGYRFPPPSPIDAVSLRVGVMLHLFYSDLADEFAAALSRMPVPFVLLVSVSEADAVAVVREAFSGIPGVQRLEIVVVPNRGRDIAPLLVTFREALLELDVIAHLHSKKSLHAGSAQNRWRGYLVDGLMGSPQRIAWQLGMFDADPSLGIIYPESHETVPLWGHTWLGNVADASAIAARMGFSIDPQAYIDFPAGSMFWARIDAIRPLLALQLPLEAFPEERGQLDGTLQHAIERMFVAVARARGFRAGVLPRDGTLSLTSEGDRNWQDYFATPLAGRIAAASIDATLVSVDIFDTLVQRPFLSPAAARAYLERLAQRTLAVDAFAELRARAEARARHALTRDPTLAEIYDAMCAVAPDLPVEALHALERATEQRLLRPRTGLLDALAALRERGTRLVALSDMYLDKATLREILPPPVVDIVDGWYVSCETGHRKDDGDAWPTVASAEQVASTKWLHIGDNEHADVQQPHWQNMLTPVHVLRASALLDVVPTLRPLRTAPDAHWGEQLRLGLIANHMSGIADGAPEALAGRLHVSPRTFGYTVIGPLVLDFLTWLVRLAREREVSRLLFLSREGHLLVEAFHRLKVAAPAWTGEIDGVYFLASRQACGLAALRDRGSLATLLDCSYNGTLGDLLVARLGNRAKAVLESRLGGVVMHEHVFLPEMHEAVADRLAPAHDALEAFAGSARALYREYWDETVGDARGMLVDIGYAGTIQRHLSSMLERPLEGAYFALDTRADARLQGAGSAQARYHDARHDSGRSDVLGNDLLLESVLTAPHPQFTGFEIVDGARRPSYATPDTQPRRWSIVAEVQAAAMEFIDDALLAAGPLADELAFDPDAVQVPLACIGAWRWHAPWLADIGVDDAFTGRGQVAAATPPPP